MSAIYIYWNSLQNNSLAKVVYIKSFYKWFSKKLIPKKYLTNPAKKLLFNNTNWFLIEKKCTKITYKIIYATKLGLTLLLEPDRQTITLGTRHGDELLQIKITKTSVETIKEFG